MTSSHVDAQDDESLRIVDDWAEVYEELYQEGHAKQEDAGPFSGWIDELTDKPYPQAVMEQWRERTLERVRSLRPRRVLDIGAGTGLVARGLAEQTECYIAIDSTTAGLADLAAASPGPGAVQVRQMHAHEIDPESLGRDDFDLVILNSVVQYFPNSNYLSDVLTKASRILSDDGTIFLGDVRDGRRDDERISEIARRQAPWALGTELKEHQRALCEREREFVFDPRMLAGQVACLGMSGHVLARCLVDSGLSRYRVDIVLRNGIEDGSVHTGGPGELDVNSVSVRRWEELGNDEASRARRAKELLAGGEVVDAPDGLLCPIGPTQLEAVRLSAAGADGVYMHPRNPNRLLIGARSPLANPKLAEGHEKLEHIARRDSALQAQTIRKAQS